MNPGAAISQPTQENILQWLQRAAEQPATLSVLMDLYQDSSDYFYQLAVAGVTDDAPAWAKDIAELAAIVRGFVRCGFELDEQSRRIVGTSRTLCLGESEFESARAFLRELGGLSEHIPQGRDYSGLEISAAEVRFAVGTEEEYRDDKKRSNIRRELKPQVLRLGEQDLLAVRHGMPAYVVHELRFCATRVVQAPTVVFQGVRRRGRLNGGRAYCGKPRKSFDNAGNSLPAHPGMVYCVYADPEGNVFDWDWVPEHPLRPGYPENYGLRFANPINEPTEAALVLPDDLEPEAFKEARAWHSRLGDCMFFYASDAPAYARRVNDDLTEYRTFESRDLVGCKVKNFLELLTQVTQRRPGDSVAVTSILAASLVRQMETHQQREKSAFLTLIAEAARLMNRMELKHFWDSLAKMDAREEGYVSRVCEMVLNLTKNPEHPSLQQVNEFLQSRRAIQDSYLNLITAAANINVEAAA